MDGSLTETVRWRVVVMVESDRCSSGEKSKKNLKGKSRVE
jgi:hypothetical protein